MVRDELVKRLDEMGDAPDYRRLATEVLGIRGAPEALARRFVEQALVFEDRHEAWRRVGERICRRAPQAAGVYVLRDAAGHALYVGKAVNLRRRLRAHFADRRWRGVKPAMARAVDGEWEEVGSELEALLREAMLIRQLQPPVNIQVGPPRLRTRALPRAGTRDVVVILPSADPEAAELVGARADGNSLICRAHRTGVDLQSHADRLWQFFADDGGEDLPMEKSSLAPIVFSWLAGRGADTTRLDPRDVGSARELRQRLEVLLKDTQLFVERIVSCSDFTSAQDG